MKRAYSTMDSPDGTSNKVALVERNLFPRGVELINPYRTTKSSTQDIVQLAMEIQKADDYIKANAQNKLHVIAEQMKFLQMQAQKVLQEAKEGHMLHHAACNFIKHPGKIYHLYEKPSGQTYFSMLSPEEWGSTGPSQTFRGSYRLEHDNSWTPLAKIEAKDAELSVYEKHLSKNSVLAIDSTDLMSIDP
ncbi:uncharacterized protein C1orf50 homolog [Diachasma alloeum]|uniref:uncharacterized protein C1orf50 homolog n=1 Tax=Diachasma alloeum TaxID=454923 RepID=UPI0007383F7C|nr:uncharacterized protein C1orf50 homolog [Diachasma alloeum]XP_015115312.1 uncharacterized protein C1orf50 homolog [Diachasma alloeum]